MKSDQFSIGDLIYKRHTQTWYCVLNKSTSTQHLWVCKVSSKEDILFIKHQIEVFLLKVRVAFNNEYTIKLSGSSIWTTI